MRLVNLFLDQVNFEWPRRDSGETFSFLELQPEYRARIAKIRYGELSVSPSSARIQGRWWPRFASHWDIAHDLTQRPGLPGVCHIFYAFPLRSPGFLTVNYMNAGEDTRYSTLLSAIRLVDDIARIRGAKAIVCQAYSSRLTPRLLNRWGYVQHAQSLGDNHFIRRLG